MAYRQLLGGLLLLGFVLSSSSWGDGWDPTSKAGNTDSILNTRHNLTMTYTPFKPIMDAFRNDYYEVCVYCHTPHGANTLVDAPLWNRSRTDINYTVYTARSFYTNPVTTYDQKVSQPGPNSLTCLSCHDGVIAVDSILNMPTRNTGALAGYGPQHQMAVGNSNKGFLNQWDQPNSPTRNHAHLNRLGGGQEIPCMMCHNGNAGIPDFRLFQIAEDGVNLQNDHPIGVTYPTIDRAQFQAQQIAANGTSTTVAVDAVPEENYRVPNGLVTTTRGPKVVNSVFFDRNGNNRLEKNEVRLYDSGAGDGPEVECASCHDPHGVPEGASGTKFFPSFLRVSNRGSTLCLTCHIK